MNIHEKILSWESTDGKVLFEDLGLLEDAKILDYGCGFGHYTIAASRFLKGRGTIYAVDINKLCLNHIKNLIEVEGLENIRIEEGNKDYLLKYEDNYFDMIMYYDMFHGCGTHRFIMLREAHRTLHTSGILSILPFHLSNFTSKEGKKKKYTYNMIIEEIEEFGFKLDNEKNKMGIHFEKYHSPYYINKGGIEFEELERGKILTFRRIQ